jgi:hypothetical protein
VTILVGHFGSGKTEIALNWALEAAAGESPVTLVDLDIVKPYFRSRAARELLAQKGIELLAPRGESAHADLPIIVPEIRNHLREGGRKILMDVGGDDTGARVVGSLSDVMPGDDVDCLAVLNFRRPFTRTPAEAEAMVRQIEAVSRVAVNAVISNTHLMQETTPEIVREGYELAVDTARLLAVPMRAVTVAESMLGEIDSGEFECPLMALKRIIVPPFEQRLGQPSEGPLFVVS